MMLRIALRMQWAGLIACSAIGVVLGLVQTIGFAQVAGSTAAQRALFGQQMELFGRQVSYLIPLPVRADTMAGYVQWRVFGSLALFFGFWALMSATGAIRGEEERGLLEQWLSASVSRGRLIGTRLLSFGLGAAAAIALTDLACAAGALASGENLPALGLLEDGAALLALSLVCFALAMLLAQAVSDRREAAGVAGAVLLALFLLNSLSRTEDGLRPYTGISPFSYYDRTNALAPGGIFDLYGTVGLVAAALVVAALAAQAFILRDLGASLFRRRARSGAVVTTPARNPFLRLPVLEALYEQRIGLAFWVLGTALLGLFLVSLAKPLVDAISAVPTLGFYLSLIGGSVYAALISVFWYSSVQLLLAIYAVTQVARWSSDDTQGRLEMVLSHPVPRWRVVIERAATLFVGCGVIVVAASLVTMFVTATQGITLEGAGVLRAGLLLIPFSLTFGALGGAITGYLPRAAIPALTALAVASYFLQQFGLLFKWPDRITNLSVFQLYGTPLVSGVYWFGLWVLTGISVVGFALALVTMQRRDVGS